MTKINDEDDDLVFYPVNDSDDDMISVSFWRLDPERLGTESLCNDTHAIPSETKSKWMEERLGSE
jgi:hypothetical protein